MPPAAANASFTPFNAMGIRLVPYGSPTFGQLLSASWPPALPTSTLAVLPYSLYVVNSASKPVIAFTVSWSSVDSMGEATVDYRTVWDVISLAAVIPPNGGSLATIVGPVSAASLSGEPLFGGGQERAQILQAQTSVVVALDAVVFSDGTSVGPDKSQAVTQMMTRLRAERDLYTSVSTSAKTESNGAITAWLQTISSQAVPGSTLSLDGGADPAWYQYYQARLSDSLVRFALGSGVPAMVAYVQSVLKAKPYPPTL